MTSIELLLMCSNEAYIIKQLALFKLSLLLKNYLQGTQTLQVNKNWKVYTKVIKTKQRGLALFSDRESLT
jgi:hypothetical protein